MLISQASQWAGPGRKFLSPAQTRPKPWRAQPEPDPNPTRPKKARAAQTAQTIDEQGLIQFYLKMLTILTLVLERLSSCIDSIRVE